MDGASHGRPFRLPNYDYAQNGCYFVTFCTKDREALLAGVHVGRGLAPGMPGSVMLELTETGTILNRQILALQDRFPVHILNYVIMPNHCHILMEMRTGEVAGGKPPAHNAPLPGRPLHEIVGACKSLTTRLANQLDRTPGRVIFQPSYHDHIIRSDKDFAEHWSYIDGNAARWTEDEYYPNPQNI